MPKWPVVTKVPQGTRWPPSDGRNIVTSTTELATFRPDYGIAFGSGTAVASWAPMGTSNDTLVGTGTARPAFEAAGFNGQPSVLFDGTDDCLIASGTAISTAVSGNDKAFAAYIVFEFAALSAGGTVFGFANSARNDTYHWMYGTTLTWTSQRQAGDAATIPSGGTTAATTKYVMRHFFSGTTTTVRLNQTIVISAAAQDNASATFDRFSLGNLQIAVPTGQANIRIAEARFYAAQPNASEDSALSNYFYERYGIVS